MFSLYSTVQYTFVLKNNAQILLERFFMSIMLDGEIKTSLSGNTQYRRHLEETIL
jgi:hypothetical protein